MEKVGGDGTMEGDETEWTTVGEKNVETERERERNGQWEGRGERVWDEGEAV